MKIKVDNAHPKTKDSPLAKRQQQLTAELDTLRIEKSTRRLGRAGTLEEISSLNTQFKSRVAEAKAARGRIAFKNVDEVDKEIVRLEKQVDAGTMKLVDEKKALAEVSNLRKQRRCFAGFDEAQKGIDSLKSRIDELRRSLEIPEAQALSEKLDKVRQELTAVKKEQDEAWGNFRSLRKEQSLLNDHQRLLYAHIRTLKDDHFNAKMAFRDWEQEQYKVRQEKIKNERDAYQKEKRRKTADQKLEEASQPAFADEILTAEGLIRYFEPSSVEPSKALRGPSGFAAEVQRSVDGSEFKGTKVCKKEDREDNYFTGTGGKRGKKGKKGSNAASPAPSTPTEGKFNISIGIIEELAKVNVEPPINQAGVLAVVEKLKQKRDQWKKDQEAKTREVGYCSSRSVTWANRLQNIERAQKEIDRLEIEANEAQNASPPPSSKRSQDSGKKQAANSKQANGVKHAAADSNEEKEPVADVTEALKEASIKDKTEE